MSKRYNICVPRKYTTGNPPKEKTHFWPVGVMWPMREKDGFNIELYTRVLPTDKLCAFVVEPKEATSTAEPREPGEDDDIPF